MDDPAVVPVRSRLAALAEALESDDYDQGRKNLRQAALQPGGRPLDCCLGVACEVYRKATGKGSWEPGLTANGDVLMFITGTGRTRTTDVAFLPQKVARWYGIPGDDLRLMHEGKIITGIAANDRYRLSFREIAQLIRSTYLS